MSLPFKVHHLEVSRRHYLLLPKLNDMQTDIITKRLKSEGFSVSGTSTMVAKSGRGKIHVDPAGLCWSFIDPQDLILPTIPDLLRCHKQAIPRRALASLYIKTRGPLCRLVTRVESGPLWESLRATGQCGLTPDEHAVALALMRNASDFPLLTDSPGSNLRSRTVGRRRYFEARIGEAETVSILRMAGERHQRNAYLPRDGLFRLVHLPNLADTLSRLGEWCYFTTR